MKNRNLFWGILLILAAIFMITNQLGLFIAINPFRLIFTVFLVVIIIKNIPKLHFTNILLPLALLLILYKNNIGLSNLSSWAIFMAGCLASAGLSMIVKPRRHSHDHNTYDDEYYETAEDINDNIISGSVSFGSDTKYLYSDHLERADFTCSFGSLKVFFDHAQLSPGGAEVFIDASFASVELYIPRTWQVVDRISTSLASVNGRGGSEDPTAPILTLTGNITLSSVQIKYI